MHAKKVNAGFDNVRLLDMAIESFNEAAQKIGEYYQSLEKRVKELDVELKEKNAALKLNLKEKENVKNYLNNILESISTGVLVVDLQGRIKTFNRSAEKMTGLISSNIVGEKIDDIFSKVFLNNLDFSISYLNSLNENTELEADIRGRDNNVICANISVSSVNDSSGKKIGTVVVMQDITRMKKLEKLANRTDRLAAMGEMAVKIAHEVRNPLGSIELFTGVLRKDLEGLDELQELAGYISSGVKNINNIVSNLLLFVKPDQRPDFKVVDIHDSIDDSLVFLDHLTKLDNGITIVKKYSEEPLLIRGDTGLLKQVYLNLILNAVQAMKNGGRLTISTRGITGPQKDLRYAEVILYDTGIGIPKSDIPEVFNPFFTTKKSGTGLGLAIVHNIIKAHGGTVDITSSGRGTECIINLPLTSFYKKDG